MVGNDSGFDASAYNGLCTSRQRSNHILPRTQRYSQYDQRSRTRNNPRQNIYICFRVADWQRFE